MSEVESLAPPTHPAWGVRAAVEDEEIAADPPFEHIGEHFCPECGKSFDTKQGLGSHRWGSHKVSGEPRTNRKKPKTVEGVQAKNKSACPSCGKMLLVSSLPKHIARFHAEYIDGLHADRSSGYDVDDIFNTVVSLLCPDSVPTKALPELLAWRAATQRLLDTLVSS